MEQGNAEPKRCLLMVSEGDEKQEEKMMGANERVAVESQDDEEWIENRAHDEAENHVRQAMDKKIESVIKRKMRCVWSAPGQRSESQEEVSQYSSYFTKNGLVLMTYSLSGHDSGHLAIFITPGRQRENEYPIGR